MQILSTTTLTELDQISLILKLVDRHKGILARGLELERIGVDPVWRGTKGREHFIRWSLANGFSPDLEIDRRDNKKGYSPDNCQWITKTENLNKDQRRYELFGRTWNVRELYSAGYSVVSYRTLISRLWSGWPIEEALTRPANNGNKWARGTA